MKSFEKTDLSSKMSFFKDLILLCKDFFLLLNRNRTYHTHTIVVSKNAKYEFLKLPS